jgi:hypothetical protein
MQFFGVDFSLNSFTFAKASVVKAYTSEAFLRKEICNMSSMIDVRIKSMEKYYYSSELLSGGWISISFEVYCFFFLCNLKF